nr:immunoglobulin heavy chain junction region [Macaca mulatta]
CARRDSNYDSW